MGKLRELTRQGQAGKERGEQACTGFVPFTVISLIFLVFSSIHFSRRIFSVALISSFSFLISWLEANGNTSERSQGRDPSLAWEPSCRKARREPTTPATHSTLPHHSTSYTLSQCPQPLAGWGCCCLQTSSTGGKAKPLGKHLLV